MSDISYALINGGPTESTNSMRPPRPNALNSARLYGFITALAWTMCLLQAVHASALKIHPPQLIPAPRVINVRPGLMPLGAHSRIVAKSADLKPLATLFANEIAILTGTGTGASLPVSDQPGMGANIILEIDPGLKPEQYTVNIDHDARVAGADLSSVAYGTATLLQCLQSGSGKVSLPHLSITDQPVYSYRGAMIDLGRKYHSPRGIEQVIELCRLYKIRFLHLHLSDDQLFMFPSSHSPQIGRSNQEFTRFEPGSKPHVEPYTRQELMNLERFARDRGIYLVPEIDLPGHSGRLIADAPETFGIPGRGSTVNIASHKTLAALTTLINEVMDVFQSTPYIHLGADEVALEGIDQTPEYREAQREYGILSVHELYSKFVSDMNNVILKRGKRAIVWEEACETAGSYPLPKDAVVMIWSQGRNPNDVVKRGYQVINATWTPLYIVRDNKRSAPFLFDWNPTLFGREGSGEFTRLTQTSNLMGAQICSWENSEAIEIQSLRDRLAVVAERTWSAPPAGSYSDFTTRYRHTDNVLEKLINPIRIDVSGRFNGDENTFVTPIVITLTPVRLLPGQVLRYTLDNSLPNANWITYSGPFRMEKTVYLRAGVFDKRGAQQDYLVGAWFRSAIPVKPNLATNRPVTVGPSSDRTDEWAAKVAVDGRSDDPMKHWASLGEAPQWLMVDLQSVAPINSIRLVTYWDGGRYYQWNAETSIDGKNWYKVLDFSANTSPATSEGYSGRFPLTNARYVRINMLKNSANPYVHIVELIVERQR